MSTTIKTNKDLSLIFVKNFLEFQHDAELLDKEWKKHFLKEHKKHPNERFLVNVKDRKLVDALMTGFIEVNQKALKNLRNARDSGMLLFCFDGTKVLEGSEA